jgi:hypothetical protein
MAATAETVGRQALLAMAVLAAFEGRSRPQQAPEIEDISAFLFRLHEAGVDIGDLTLRRVRGGYYSEDVETLVGHYLGSGYAQRMSPVSFTEKGFQLLHEIVADEKKTNPEALENAARILGVAV